MTPKPMTKAVAVALIQVLIICSLGAKLLYDRRTRPQAWFKTDRFDPNLPIRGRYVSLLVEVNDSRSPEEVEKKFGTEIQGIENSRSKYGFPRMFDFGRECGSIAVRDGVPMAEFDRTPGWNCDNLTFVRRKTASGIALRLTEPSLFFISDTAKDPTGLARGDELWVLATIPRKGPPRPIALGVKKAGEKYIRPLHLN
ncbi:MAG TPA: hypothetical protein VE957_20685 [Terriglobales bacterium]|jgi:hypothetical protein|nr:hypothetical protein [Terriglobales bacterium]